MTELLFYTVVGVILAVVGGKVLSMMHAERYLKNMMKQLEIFTSESESFNQRQRLNYALNDTKIIVRKVFPYVLLGVLIGAVIHNWIPQEFILSILGNNNPFAVILATVIGVPIYADIFGTLPIAEAFVFSRCASWYNFSFDDGDNSFITSITYYA